MTDLLTGLNPGDMIFPTQSSVFYKIRRHYLVIENDNITKSYCVIRFENGIYTETISNSSKFWDFSSIYWQKLEL